MIQRPQAPGERIQRSSNSVSRASLRLYMGTLLPRTYRSMAGLPELEYFRLSNTPPRNYHPARFYFTTSRLNGEHTVYTYNITTLVLSIPHNAETDTTTRTLSPSTSHLTLSLPEGLLSSREPRSIPIRSRRDLPFNENTDFRIGMYCRI